MFEPPRVSVSWIAAEEFVGALAGEGDGDVLGGEL